MLRLIELDCLLQVMGLFNWGEVVLTVIPPEVEFVDRILRVRPTEDEQIGHCKRD